jgi:hypothetical protein
VVRWATDGAPGHADGIDADNVASRRCADSAGFRLIDPVPLYYQREALT